MGSNPPQGGGAAGAATEIVVADESSDTSCNVLYSTSATGDLAPKTGDNLTFNSNTGVLTATGFAGPITGDVTGNTSGTSGSTTGNAATATALATARTIGGTSFDGTGNIAITTNANLTGEITSSGNATTVTDNIIDEANLKISNAPTNGQALTAQSGNTGGLTWATAGGAYEHGATTFALQGSAPSDPATDKGVIYMKDIDTNNEGLFMKVKKNGAVVEVQIL